MEELQPEGLNQRGLQEDIIARDDSQAIIDKALKEFGSKERETVKVALAMKAFFGYRIEMSANEIKRLLASQTQSREIRLLGEYITKLNMIVFKRAFLSRLHGITVKDTGTARTISSKFEVIGRIKLSASVSQENFDVLVEQLVSQNSFEGINATDHICRRLGLVEQGEEEGETGKLEGLNEGAVGYIVIYCIHLHNAGRGMFSNILPVFLEGTPFQEAAVFTLFILNRLLFGKLAT